ncbi:MAG TPA: hypothetical protein VJS44_04695 [Pyrinomonadaceae bacterium]|nr:hypothetical protein [Pyrinomonadaceae bacterium]
MFYLLFMVGPESLPETIWITLLKELGLPLVLLAALLWLLYKKGLPYLERQNARLDEQRTKFEQTLTEQVAEARRTRASELRQFLNELDKRDEINKAHTAAQAKHTEVLESLVTQVSDLRNEIKK